ncbi:MAG TPA: glycosyltransferase [Acidimicrobiales bacterium]|nr:glycosyltransferase [Acidimicrobiales bacterium]
MTPAVSVALPLYATRAAVPELIDRLQAALRDSGPVELVFVDDGCPERSYEEVAAHPADGVSVVLVRHKRNEGQHAAVLTALRAASGEVCAVMDADLQDAPEDLPVLLRALAEDPSVGAVAAGRRGRYEEAWRQHTARAFRWAMHTLTRGRVPVDAGLFLVMTRRTRDRILELDDPAVHLVAALGRLRIGMHTVPVVRRCRPTGATGYGRCQRAFTAARSLVVVTPLYPLYRRVRPRSAPATMPVLSDSPRAR